MNCPIYEVWPSTAEKPVMAQIRRLWFGLSHLGMKTGQFKPLGSQLERSLKALFHEPYSLNDHFLSIAITKPMRSKSGGVLIDFHEYSVQK